MVMYWYRCISGIYDPVQKCPLLDAEVSAHFCIICPYRGKECKNPVWFSELGSHEKEDRLRRIVDAVMGSSK
ncbi:hypothetical protein IPA_09810 [Ignicoccus pacificus DSM 13166]|uniref:Uncharacterized protein n=1 Tax=Ignicoccus pacificus DSM 13166 TaxID=940294 RepID=A0A977KA97_9CREN|nr:hypothetical protein IPA_09810 [Ignicoccus pacificus DSM 13166]